MPTVAEISERLTELLMGRATELSDPNGSDLDFFPSIEPKPLERLSSPSRLLGRRRGSSPGGRRSLPSGGRYPGGPNSLARRTAAPSRNRRSSGLTSSEGAAAALRPNVLWPRWARPWARSRPST